MLIRLFGSLQYCLICCRLFFFLLFISFSSFCKVHRTYTVFNTDKIYCSALKWRSIWDEKKNTHGKKVRYTVLIGYPQVAKQFESISFYKLMNCKWTKNGIGIRKDQSQNSRFRFIFSIWTNSVSICKYKLLSKIENTNNCFNLMKSVWKKRKLKTRTQR